VKRPDHLADDHHCPWREWAEELEVRVDTLEHEVALLKRHVFGKRSEKMPPIKQLLRVGDARNSPEAQARRRQNAEERTNLPERLIHHRIPDDQRVCPKCGGTTLRSLGDGKVTTMYEYVPSKIERQVHVQETLSCRCGEGVITAPPPPKVIEKGLYGPGFIAHALVAKCADSIPLYRLAKIYSRHGAPVNRSTLVSLFHTAAELVSPIANRILEKVAESELVNADETPIPVQAPEETRKAYLWTFVGDDLIGYKYSASRSGDTPMEVLGSTEGALVVDAYTGYNQVTQAGRRTRVGCWAHVRRKIFDARAMAPEAAQVGLDLIRELYRVEHDALAARVIRTDEHLRMRMQRSAAIVDQIADWLVAESLRHPPRSSFGNAVRYAGRQWDALTRFLRDASLPLDNNAAERALRVAALGRKNFLFVGHDEAGENIAGLYSLIATCELNRINPFHYLRDVLIRVQTHPATKIDDLLPLNWIDRLAPEDSS
jgi:transposase